MTELEQLEPYLHDALGVAVAPAPWSGRKKLPHFLNQEYRFAEMDLLGLHCLLAVDIGEDEKSPVILRKHIDLLRQKQDAEVIYVRSRVTSYNRKRLIEQKVPFIIPGNQMYLPLLAIDLREHFRKIHPPTLRVSPATQAVIIQALLGDASEVLMPSELARKLGYSPMTMTRAFNELEAGGLVETAMRGRERCLRFIDTKREIWAKAQPLFRNPVMRRMLVRPATSKAIGLVAGLSALGQYTMLAPPDQPTAALSREGWKLLSQGHGFVEVPVPDEDVIEIEVWRYDPALFARDGVVDRLSLHLSLNDNQDERVQAAIDEMMKDIGW